MEIQPLDAGELRRYRAIRLRALRDAPAAFGTTWDDARRWPVRRWAALYASLQAFVAVTEDRDVGMVRTSPDPERREAVRLGSLWVAPDARGQGVGAQLVAAVVEWARSGGFQQVILEVGDDNVAAVALYDRLGFLPTGRVRPYPPPRAHLTRHERILRLAAPSPRSEE